jgi:hypothetical protein
LFITLPIWGTLSDVQTRGQQYRLTHPLVIDRVRRNFALKKEAASLEKVNKNAAYMQKTGSLSTLRTLV